MIETTQTSTGTALHALLAGLVDYAGLFPPAGLPMGDAVRKYADYRASDDAWALGRFVIPVARFGKFEAAFGALPTQSGPWLLSALPGADLSADIRAIREFNSRMEGRALIDAVEAKTPVVADIRHFASLLPGDITGYCELDLSRCEAHLTAVKTCGLRAKIRTGGVTHDAFPSAETIADFLLASAENKVAFKATAGLHHPLRREHALTYEADAERGTMHGFLNVFLAAAMAQEGRSHEEVVTMLLEEEPDSFVPSDDSIQWRQRRFSVATLLALRQDFAISFGSCSFEEPLADLRKLGWM